jgi:hypothetical protein
MWLLLATWRQREGESGVAADEGGVTRREHVGRSGAVSTACKSTDERHRRVAQAVRERESV